MKDIDGKAEKLLNDFMKQLIKTEMKKLIGSKLAELIEKFDQGECDKYDFNETKEINANKNNGLIKYCIGVINGDIKNKNENVQMTQRKGNYKGLYELLMKQDEVIAQSFKDGDDYHSKEDIARIKKEKPHLLIN